MSEKLLPCPFCGSEPFSHYVGGEDGGFHAVECTTCNGGSGKAFIGVHGDDEHECTAIWNARPAPAQDAVRVPRVPTEAMLEAAADYGGRGGYSAQRREQAAAIYADMLTAAPAVSQSLTTAAPCADEAVAELVGHVRRAPGNEPGFSYIRVHGAGLFDLPDGAPLYTAPPAAPKGDEAMDALSALYKECPKSLCCDDFHHSHVDRHGASDTCPPLSRYRAAMSRAESAIAAGRREG